MKRRGFFATLLAPLFRPKAQPSPDWRKSLYVFNPDWHGTFARDPIMDEMNRVTFEYLRCCDEFSGRFYRGMLANGDSVEGGTYIQESIKYV